jgi:hypothetical protein
VIVRMLVGLSGPAFCLEPGDEYEFPQGEAVRLVSAGIAVPVSGEVIERAVAEPAPEKRTRKRKAV